jgi:broad-specificity NMP kinase
VQTSNDANIFTKADENMDSCSIDMDDLVQCMEGASIEEEDIEDSVSSEVIRRYKQ